jgi:hypothetical protein
MNENSETKMVSAINYKEERNYLRDSGMAEYISDSGTTAQLFPDDKLGFLY